jgi:hypothetical protein
MTTELKTKLDKIIEEYKSATDIKTKTNLITEAHNIIDKGCDYFAIKEAMKYLENKLFFNA